MIHQFIIYHENLNKSNIEVRKFTFQLRFKHSEKNLSVLQTIFGQVR